MRVACLYLLGVTAVASAALPAQESPPLTYAMALKARYLPLESVRDGTVRMPKVLARSVTVQREGVLLQQALLEIATQAGLGLSYGEDLARSNTIVSLDVANGTAAEALAAAVRGTPWTVLVTAAGQVAVVPGKHRQLGAVVGRVTDRATGAGVAGATLSLEGTRFSASTDDGGQYRLRDLPPATYSVGVRRIGYVPTTRVLNVAADETTTADFTLEPSATSLDQIVVTGVPGAVSKRTLGNAITTIDVADVTQKVANTNVTELLQAKALGVSILPGGGSPGTGASIRIRGAGSLTAATAPVMYIDGVRIYTGAQGNFWNSWRSQRTGDDGRIENAYGAGQDAMALDMIKPEDIESIEVIKGPAASTLYGAEAANGVIQIITKKGQRGEQKLQWSTKVLAGSSDWAVDRPTNYTTCTPAITALRFSDGSAQFPGCQGVAANTILSSSSLDRPGALRSGDVRTYGLTLRGGGSTHSFFAAADRDQEQGVFFNSMNQRTSARANFMLYPKENLDFSVSVGYSHVHTQFPINDDGYGLIQSSMLYRPGFAIRTDVPGAEDGFEGGNGPLRINLWDNHLRANRTTLGTTMNYRPFGWMKNRLTIGLDQTSRLADKYLPPGSIWGGVKGQAERGAPQNSLYTFDYAGTINTALSPQLSSAFSLGAQYTANYYRNTVAKGSGFASGTVKEVFLAAQTESYTEVTDQKSLGMYVQEQVGWKDRLYLTGAVRMDNNSVFGDDIKELYYPKLSVAYVISEEPFFRRVAWMDQLKLRTAWGQAGNAPAPFAGQRSFTSAATINDAGERVPALRTNNIGNPKIKPERGNEIEIGADASLLGNKLGLEFTFYNKTTTDVLMKTVVPASTGFVGSLQENLGKISNRGIELALTATPVQVPFVTWDARLGLSTNRNRLVSFGDDRPPVPLSLYAAVQRHQEGYPLGGYWGNFPKRDASGNLLRDANGALIADTAVYIGPSTPTREASLSNSFTIRGNLRLFTLLDYKGGHYLFNVKDQFRCFGQPLASPWNNDPTLNMPGQCWEVNDPGRSADSREVLQQDMSINNGYFIQKADFIKFRDVSISYTLPAEWIRRVGSDRATVTLAGHNLGFLWKPHYTGPDPEVNFTGVNDPGGQFAYVRVDSWTAPMTRRITASIDLGF
jgi:TonB-dependent starch-binding outer membrane protein SusC